MSKENILTDIPKHNYVEPATKVNSDEFKKIVESRRSVRVFKDDPVNPDKLKECLELALLAPTSSNLQCWEFYWVRNDKKKEKLKEYCLNQSAAKTAKELIEEWISNRRFIEEELGDGATNYRAEICSDEGEIRSRQDEPPSFGKDCLATA